MARIFEAPKKIIAKAADVVADAADNVKDKASEGAVVIADKAGDTKDRIDKAWFGPVFSFEDISDTMPKVIHVADNQRMRNSDACDGAIGYKERIKGVKMMGLLPENIHLPGVKFYPNLDGLLYYRDPFNDHEYIDIDDYFDYLTERRVNEIKNVAHDLGAKHVRIVYKEEKKSIVSVDASEDIRLLLIMIGSDQSPSFDEDITSVANNAERIIYENLLEKLKDFCDRKDEIKAEIDAKYKPLEEKYLQ